MSSNFISWQWQYYIWVFLLLSSSDLKNILRHSALQGRIYSPFRRQGRWTPQTINLGQEDLGRPSMIFDIFHHLWCSNKHVPYPHLEFDIFTWLWSIYGVYYSLASSLYRWQPGLFAEHSGVWALKHFFIYLLFIFNSVFILLCGKPYDREFTGVFVITCLSKLLRC